MNTDPELSNTQIDEVFADLFESGLITPVIPSERLAIARAVIAAHVAAQVAVPTAVLHLTVAQLRDAASFATDDDTETEIVLARLPARTSTENEPMPAGLYLWWDDIPEEGCIGPLGAHPNREQHPHDAGFPTSPREERPVAELVALRKLYDTVISANRAGIAWPTQEIFDNMMVGLSLASAALAQVHQPEPPAGKAGDEFDWTGGGLMSDQNAIARVESGTGGPCQFEACPHAVTCPRGECKHPKGSS